MSFINNSSLLIVRNWCILFIFFFRIANLIQDIFGISILVHTVCVIFGMSVSLYYLTQFGTSNPHFFLFLFYVITALEIILFYNYFGNEVIVWVIRYAVFSYISFYFIIFFIHKQNFQQTGAIHDAIDDMNWSSFGIRTKLFLAQIMVHVNKPIVLNIAGVSTLSLTSFTKVKINFCKK